MEIPRYWRLQKKLYQMSTELCSECGSIMFSMRSKCSNCTSISNTYPNTANNISEYQVINEKLIRNEFVATK